MKALNDPVEMTYAQREILKTKPQFLEWHKMIYRYMANNKAEGNNNIEVGSGSSFLQDFIPSLIKTNILHIKFNDLTCAAYCLPFKNNSIDNIILIDVLHHLDRPMDFFSEALRILKKGGRILLSDPYISLFSYSLWKYIHPENCNLKKIGFETEDSYNPLLCANSASLTLLVGRRYPYFKECFPKLKVVGKKYHTIMHYWLAGGYNFPSFVPEKLVKAVEELERILSPLGCLLASFIFVVIEKKN